MRYYIPSHFKVQELVPQSVYMDLGQGGLMLLDARILWTIDAIRDAYSVPVIVNNWGDGGPFDQRGFRTFVDPKTRYSPHRFGRAVDLDIEGVTAEQFRGTVKAGGLKKELMYVTRIEDGVTWVHLDNVNTGIDGITFFKK